MSRLSTRVSFRVIPQVPNHAVFREPPTAGPSAGSIRNYPCLRLMATVLVGDDPPETVEDNRPVLRAIVDTGAPLTIVLYNVWRNWPNGTITWLELTENAEAFARHGGRRENDPPNGFPTRNRTVAGHTYRCWFGRIRLGVLDDDEERRLPATTVTAWFATDSTTGGLQQMLMGLEHSILHDRQLHRYWIDDAENYHQLWQLEL